MSDNMSQPAANGSEVDVFRFDISADTPVMRNLSDGLDRVRISADSSVQQVRLTFTSSEVGNGNHLDSNTMAGQDGWLAVRMQAEAGSGELSGLASRIDDEGIRFVSTGDFTFDVRDLVSGVSRGDQFDVVQLGTLGDDIFDEQNDKQAYYINAGMGNDTIQGGDANDFLVGGAGNDSLFGGTGDDSFIGGGGNDTVLGHFGEDLAIVNLSTDGADAFRLGKGLDTVNVTAAAGTTQVRVTFTSLEVGNDSSLDAGTLTGQDGGLAVRLQVEDGAGNLTGLVGRFDDEGVSFVSTLPGMTFDVRDLVSGAARGDQFQVVQLGTSGNNRFDETGEDEAYYINAGMGNDRVTGGQTNDFLVGGIGRDRLNGGEGSDQLLGGADADVFVFTGAPGNDMVLDFVSGTDKINLAAYGIGFADVSIVAVASNMVVAVDTDSDGSDDFQITLTNVAAPVEGDFIF